MPGLSQTLSRISKERRADPLAPVTVIVPSHLAGLQLRRRLGLLGPFAAVRFETLPRIAEVIGAGELASGSRSPLARPIGDYIASRVALEARAEFAEVRNLSGFGRVLRQMFRRLRRGGIASPEEVRVPLSNGYLGELMRLYGEFRSRTAAFYDEEDLLDTAATIVRSRPGSVAGDLGSIFVVPPGAMSAGSSALLKALRAATRLTMVDESTPGADESFVLAPDPASEAREVVREVLAELDGGLGLHEVAVFHGADPSYRRLLREAFDAADVPAASMPGRPLAETVAGRSVLLLASLPEEDYSRTAVMDFMAIAPLREPIPGSAGGVSPRPSTWDRLSREAGVTKGKGRWLGGLDARLTDLRAEIAGQDGELEARRNAIQYQIDLTADMQTAISALIERLEPLRASVPAREFIDRFGALVDEYLRPDTPAVAAVKAEIEQLGTVGAVGGSFSLREFVQALRANLEIATIRERGLGEGVLLADYRIAAGLEFRHVLLCGAFEGSFPAGPGSDTLIDDGDWAWLRERYPFIEDAALRVQRASEAARRALTAAGSGHLTWTAPLYEPGGTREYYPSPFMVSAAAAANGGPRTGSQLRRAASDPPRLTRAPSPLAAGLRGAALDRAEAEVRRAVLDLQAGVLAGPGHVRYPQIRLLRARRGPAFSEFDGNLAALAASGRLWDSPTASPTSLERYAECGFRYLWSYRLRLNVVEEPEEREVMEASERGSLMHGVLDAFFKEMRLAGRPQVREAWGPADRRRLLEIAEAKLGEARERGKTGLDIFAEHDARTILADLEAFLDADTVFRTETGAVPDSFEANIPPVEIAGITMRGIVDRIDRSPDGSRAWVIDYKTGSISPYRSLQKDDADPLGGGTKLQLPAYIAAASGAKDVHALYWFISRQGGFERVEFRPSPANMAAFEATVTAILEGVRRGAFPAVPGDEDEFYGTFANCRYCDFDRICSVRRDQDFDRKAHDAAVDAWKMVAEAARPL